MKIQNNTHKIDFNIQRRIDLIINGQLDHPMGPSFKSKLKQLYVDARLTRQLSALLEQTRGK